MSDKKRVPMEVRNYMSRLGKMGGSKKTDAQRSACSLNLARARLARIQKLAAAETNPRKKGKMERTITRMTAKLATLQT